MYQKSQDIADVTLNEVQKAVQEMKNNKSPGGDEIMAFNLCRLQKDLLHYKSTENVRSSGGMLN